MAPLGSGQFKIQAILQHRYKIKYSREGKWLIAEIPELNLATQGRTPKELQVNLEDLVKDYMEDPDTPKPVHKIRIDFIPKGVFRNVKTKTQIEA